MESISEFYPETKWQRCVVHYYRNVFSLVPRGKVKEVAAMLKAIHGQEDHQAAQEKAVQVATRLDGMKLPAAAKLVREGIEETLSYMSFPREYWRRIGRTIPMERIMRRSGVYKGCGLLPDGHSALMLVAARLRHIASSKWGSGVYLNMKRLYEESLQDVA